MTQTPRQAMEQMVAGLELAKSGLVWYRERYPHARNESDKMEEIACDLGILIGRAALAECSQDAPKTAEPVGWALFHSRGIELSSKFPVQRSREAAEQMAREHMGDVSVGPIYTAPQPPAPAVELTDEEIFTVADPFGAFEYGDAQGHKRLAFARAAIAAHEAKRGKA